MGEKHREEILRKAVKNEEREVEQTIVSWPKKHREETQRKAVKERLRRGEWIVI